MAAMTPEQHYRKQTSTTHRKKWGQYFTPPNIASLMISWIAGCNPSSVLDPAVGLGIFPSMYHSVDEVAHTSWDVYDIDEAMVQCTKDRLDSSETIHFHQADFLEEDWEQMYDAVIANPPYLKMSTHQHKQAILSNFEEQLGLRLPGNTNMYNLFLLKGLHQLEKGGRAAFIVPSEFLNADYGKKIKQYLLDQKLLKYVVITDFQQNWFEDAITTSVILLCERNSSNDPVEFISMYSQEDLPNVHTYIAAQMDTTQPLGKRYSLDTLDATKKWRSYYQPSILRGLQHVKPFTEFGYATRGIATGANDFFCLRKSDIQGRHLSSSYWIPCITKAQQVKTPFFTNEHWQGLFEQHAPVTLLNLQPDKMLDDSIINYIQYGETHQFHLRYLTKHRSPWYKAEVRDPAPIWFRTFNRTKLQFVRNEAGIVHLTPFHSIYIHEKYQQDIPIIMAYFLTDIAEEILKESRREYGQGLVKFEPNDLNQSYVFDFDILTKREKNDIRHLYDQLRECPYLSEEWEIYQSKLNDYFKHLLATE
ncbi:HsdM family class I SAM-dependent methyltransferase [Pontibacillus yanchengensis]|uniref:Modification methylase n=1 Tax=Pontibacillus yanchengensis Y32 TaxID=1385514 RepID=A0A0A2TEE3_9BACI|nr:N-6 DNA methylase [Pontibacillus yanchengensis]KGP74217.1 modification methylase [Pontibacillus yanchengensis Y32]